MEFFFYRVILDRCPSDMDDMWSSLDFTIHEPKREPIDPTATATTTTAVKKEMYVTRQISKFEICSLVNFT